MVLEGQALWSLAAHYEVPLSDLLLFNSLLPNAIVQPGDRITIRLADGQAPPPTPTPPTMHTVLEGQSLWSIAVQYNVKLGDILWLNQLPEDVVLQPGELIRVRLAPDETPPPTPTPILYHSVRTGQTLWEIAFTYNLTLDELLALNNIDQNTLLQPGDQLLVREAAPTPVPTLPPTETPILATPTAAPTIIPTASGTAVASLYNQSLAQAMTPEANAESADSTESNPERPAIVGIVTGLAVGLLVIGLLAVVVLRSEII
jgi:LysM repeat protein